MAQSIGIVGTGSAVPAHLVSNAELATMVDTDPEWIVKRTGIRQHYIADEQTASSDLAIIAAQHAMAAAGITPEAVGIVVCATVTPDMLSRRPHVWYNTALARGRQPHSTYRQGAAALSTGWPARFRCSRVAWAATRW